MAEWSDLEELMGDYADRFKINRAEETRIRLWDGDWNLVAEVQGEYSHSFKFIRNDAGEASLNLPVDHAVGMLLMDSESWPTESMYVTFDRDNVRWSGRVQNSKVSINYAGEQQVEVSILHDYQKLKELLVWANPFLPAEVQFPKAWFLYAPAKWAVTLTLLVNLLRKNNSLWMLPDDPLDIRQWFDLDMSGWNMTVKPVSFVLDRSLPAAVFSRFKYFHDCVKDICADAQLNIDCRRYLPGDEPPIPGMNLRYGCLVFEVQDKSGWGKETSFGGWLTSGLTRYIRRLNPDGLTEGLDYVPNPTQPEEYQRPWWRGSLPEAPWVVLQHGDRTGVQSTEFEYTPSGPSQFVTGGSSMPGVNEGIKSVITGVGGFIGSLFNQSQIGAAADAILEPLYSDVFMAFMAHKYHSRIKKQGWDYPFEYWVDGSDKAYTLSALTSLRKAKYETRERYAVQVDMQEGVPYEVGSDFFVGDRIAVHALGMPKDKLFVEMVDELEFVCEPNDVGWKVSVGKPEFSSGLNFLAERFMNTTNGLKELGVW